MGHDTPIMENKETKTETPWLSYSGVADRWGVSAKTVKRMARDGRLKAYTIGPRTVRFKFEEIESYENEAAS